MTTKSYLAGILVVIAAAAEAEPYFDWPNEKPCVAPLLYSPVCASNGETFPNKWLLRCYNKENNKRLKIVLHGPCPVQEVEDGDMMFEGDDDVREKYYPVGRTYQARVKHNCICTKEYDPVCASNRKTFNNRCYFDCYNKTHGMTLTIVHAKRCSNSQYKK